MSCCDKNTEPVKPVETNCSTRTNQPYSYIIIIVLYILLAIILGACLNY